MKWCFTFKKMQDNCNAPEVNSITWEWHLEEVCGFFGSLRSARKHESLFPADFYFWGNTCRLFSVSDAARKALLLFMFVSCEFLVVIWEKSSSCNLLSTLSHCVEQRSSPFLHFSKQIFTQTLPFQGSLKTKLNSKVGEQTDTDCTFIFKKNSHVVSVNNDCFWKKSLYCLYLSWWTFLQSTAHVEQDRMKWWPGRRLTL